MRRVGRAVDAGAPLESVAGLAVARELGYPVGEVLALAGLSVAALDAGDQDRAVRLARQAGQITDGIPGSVARWTSYVLTVVLTEVGEVEPLSTAVKVTSAGPSLSVEAS